MISTLELIMGIIIGTSVVILIEEAINHVVRVAAKMAGTNPTVIRDFGVGMRVIAILVIIAVILSLTGLSSELTTVTLSGLVHLPFRSRYKMSFPTYSQAYCFCMKG